MAMLLIDKFEQEGVNECNKNADIYSLVNFQCKILFKYL